ncbi:MAG: Asp23/Gls24 family envelope stress response protein, partial [Aminobacterium colombiense]|nr:Asp23/Gls24 family envelope stress response protein [Aminobacterium colombiense]
MDEVHNTLDLESQEQEKEPEGAIEEQTMAAEERSVQGSVHIAEDVITELARKTLSLVPGVQPA